MSSEYKQHPEFSDKSFVFVDIRNPELLKKYPFLQQIREAMICVFDHFVHLAEDTSEKAFQVKLDSLSAEEKANLSEVLPSVNEDERLSAYWLYKLTRSQCEEASRGIQLFLQQHYGDEFKVDAYTAHTELKHFVMHDFVIVHHLESGNKIGVFLGNVFNPDFSLPTFEGNQFQRNDTVIVAKNNDDIIEVIEKIEGGSDWQIKPESHFPKYEMMEEYIKSYK